MCNCIKKFEAQLAEEMQKEKPCNEVIKHTQPSPILVYSSDGYPIYLDCTGRVAPGKSTRIFTPIFLFTYCPFCGEKITYKKQK